MRRLRNLLRDAAERRHWSERFWWFDLIYPTSLAVILFASLTGLVYFGKPSSRLSNLAERKLLEYSLRLAPAPVPTHAADILVVSGTPTELEQLRPAPLGRRPELSAAEYASAIERLAAAGAEAVVVSWDLAAHPVDDVYYLPLVEVAKRYAGRTALIFAVAQDRSQDFPAELAQLVDVVVDDPCVEKQERTVLCPYNAAARDWVISRIIELATVVSAPSTTVSLPWLTAQLPSNLDAYAVHIPPASSLRRLSFGELLADASPYSARHAGDASPARAPRLIFMGFDVAGATSGTTDARFVRTIFDDEAVAVEAGGTPYHVFWASLASMVLDREMLVFPPDWVRIAMTTMVCLTLLGTVLARGGGAGLALLCGYALVVVAANARLAIPRGWFFFAFDSLYLGSATLIFATTGRVSYTSFRRWRAQALQRLHARTVDLKSNFVSLVSHNLTTPVAKMQGMLGIVQGQVRDAVTLQRLRAAQVLATRIELTIRFVLNTTALEDLKIHAQTRSPDALLKEFTASATGTLHRIGVAVAIERGGGDENDAWLLPVQIDSKLVVAALVALAALHAPAARDGATDGDQRRDAGDRLSGSGDADLPTTNRVKLRVDAQLDDDGGVRLRLCAEGPRKATGPDDFFEHVTRAYLTQIARAHAGSFELGGFELTTDGDAATSILQLRFGPVGATDLAVARALQ